MTLNSTKLLQMWPKINPEMILKWFKNGLKMIHNDHKWFKKMIESGLEIV